MIALCWRDLNLFRHVAQTKILDFRVSGRDVALARRVVCLLGRDFGFLIPVLCLVGCAPPSVRFILPS
jgi:hypothetical protein